MAYMPQAPRRQNLSCLQKRVDVTTEADQQDLCQGSPWLPCVLLHVLVCTPYDVGINTHLRFSIWLCYGLWILSVSAFLVHEKASKFMSYPEAHKAINWPFATALPLQVRSGLLPISLLMGWLLPAAGVPLMPKAGIHVSLPSKADIL